MYLLIENFNSGLDSRRMALTSKPGTLQEIINCHITRGGEIEKRKAFIPITTLPAGTFGLHAANDQLLTFGASPTVTISPIGATPPADGYQSFIVPSLAYSRLQTGGSSVQFELSDALIPSPAAISKSYRLRVTMSGQGGIGGGDFTFTGTTKPANGYYATEYINANSFYIQTGSINSSANVVVATTYEEVVGYQTDGDGNTVYDENGNAITITETRTISSSSVSSELESRTATISFAGTTALPSVCTLRFPEASGANGDYTITKTGSSSFTVSGSNLADVITKAYVAPAITSVRVGATELLAATVNWSFTIGGDASSRNETAKVLATEINNRTSITGASAYVLNGSIVLTSNVSVGTALTVTTRSILVNSTGNFGSNGASMTKVLHAENFGGKVYAIAEFDGNKIQHFYDGVRVNSWDTIANSGSLTTVALAIAREVYKDGEYAATSSGNVIKISFVRKNTSHVVTAATVNGGSSTNQTATVATVTAPSPTASQVVTITLGGTYESNDIYNIFVDGVLYSVQAQSSSVGVFSRTYNNKMYSISGSLLYFSEADTFGGPSAFSNDTDAGAGVINMANQDAGSEGLTSIAIYQGKLAIFSKSAVQIWTMNADPRQNAQSQILTNIGTFAPKSVVSLGNIDTYFLSSSGIRSLRARDASNVAIVSDVGTTIDEIVLADLRNTTQEIRERAIGIIDPVEGRYWLCMGSRIYVYSNYPTNNISAWSIYEPGFVDGNGDSVPISDITVLNNRIYCRAGDVVYAYGGLNGNTYDNSKATVTMPYLDGGKPGHFKSLLAIDSACVGEWDIYSGTDIMAPDIRDYIGKIVNSTYSMGRVSAVGIGTHVGIQMKNSADGYAKIGNFAVHFEINDAG